MELIRLVNVEGISIKKAALKLKINYSTAKFYWKHKDKYESDMKDQDVRNSHRKHGNPNGYETNTPVLNTDKASLNIGLHGKKVQYQNSENKFDDSTNCQSKVASNNAGTSQRLNADSKADEPGVKYHLEHFDDLPKLNHKRNKSTSLACVSKKLMNFNEDKFKNKEKCKKSYVQKQEDSLIKLQMN